MSTEPRSYLWEISSKSNSAPVLEKGTKPISSMISRFSLVYSVPVVYFYSAIDKPKAESAVMPEQMDEVDILPPLPPCPVDAFPLAIQGVILVAANAFQVPVSEITQAANQGMSEAAIITGAKVGRVCRELGLEGKKGGKGKRVILITPEIPARLKVSATTATNATSLVSSISYMGGIMLVEASPTATQPELGVADVADEDQNATQLNLGYHNTSGGCGGCGGSLGAKGEFSAEVTI
jgi:hypothetical protein